MSETIKNYLVRKFGQHRITKKVALVLVARFEQLEIANDALRAEIARLKQAQNEKAGRRRPDGEIEYSSSKGE